MADDKPSYEDLEATIASLELRFADARAERDRERYAATAASKAQAATAEQNDALREQLHMMTIENARLQGYQDRVKEFDPVSDKIAYGDQTHPIFVQPPRPYRDGSDGGSSMVEAFGRFEQAATKRSPAWYRRG